MKLNVLENSEVTKEQIEDFMCAVSFITEELTEEELAILGIDTTGEETI